MSGGGGRVGGWVVGGSVASDRLVAIGGRKEEEALPGEITQHGGVTRKARALEGSWWERECLAHHERNAHAG